MTSPSEPGIYESKWRMSTVSLSALSPHFSRRGSPQMHQSPLLKSSYCFIKIIWLHHPHHGNFSSSSPQSISPGHWELLWWYNLGDNHSRACWHHGNHPAVPEDGQPGWATTCLPCMLLLKSWNYPRVIACDILVVEMFLFYIYSCMMQALKEWGRAVCKTLLHHRLFLVINFQLVSWKSLCWLCQADTGFDANEGHN